MSIEEDRGRLLALITKRLGPSRWHPLQRRKWRRMMADMPTIHWASLTAEQEDAYQQIKAHSDAVCAAMSEELPDGYEFRYDWPTGE